MTVPDSPYVGAEPLGHENQIFGRDREIRDLFFLLSKERIALLYSPSGAGKSSILFAEGGLLDQFVDRFDVLPVTRVNTETKLTGVNRYALSMLLGLERLAEAPRKDSELAALSLRDAVMQRPGGEGHLTLIVVDQFEEIVRVDPTDIAGKREFFRQLGELLAEPTIWALFVLREDFLATLDPYIRQLPTHLKNRFRIDLLKPDQAAKAIAGPAEKLERKWVSEAATKLANNLSAETGTVEPMHLQIVCQDIWDGMPENDMQVDPEDVTEFGDVDKVLGRFYGRIVGDAAKLGHNSEREIRNWVGTKLVVTGGVRGQVLAAEAGLGDKTIEVLDKAHLIRREPRRGADWLELAHDRLVPAVTKDNAKWFEENLSDLERRTEHWHNGGRGDDLLADGAPYREMRKWAKQNPDRVKADEQAFLLASKRKAAATMWRRISTVVSLALAIVAFILFLNAQREKRNAETASLRARFSQATLYDDRAEQAMQRGDLAEAWLYTLGALAEDWPENSKIPAAAGRLLLRELHPDVRFNEVMKSTVLLTPELTGNEAAAFELRAVWAPKGAPAHFVAGSPNKNDPARTDYFELIEADTRFKKLLFSFKKNESGYSKDFQGPFSVAFHTGLKQFVFGGDKRVFIGGQPEIWHSAETVSVIAQSGNRIAVAEPTGTIRFLDTKLRSVPGQSLVSGVTNPMSLAFHTAAEQLAAVGSLDGKIAVFRQFDKPRPQAYSLELGSGSVQALAFIDDRTLVAATADTRIHFIGRDPKDTWKLLQSAKVGEDIVSISTSGPQNDIALAGGDGAVRKVQLEWEVFDVAVSMLELFRNPRAPSQLAKYRQLLEASERELHRRFVDSRLTAANADPLAAEAERIYFGKQPVALSYAIPEGAFIRKESGDWVWERDGLTTPLQVKSDSSTAMVLSHLETGFTVTIPKSKGGDRRIQFGDGKTSWPAAVAVRSPKESPDRIRYAESYLEGDFGAWRIRTPERDSENEHAWLADYDFAPTLLEISDPTQPLMQLRSTKSALQNTSNTNDFSVPRAGGMAEWGGAKRLKLFRLTRSEGPESRSVHTSGQRRTVYEAVSINGQGPTYQATPGAPLELEFRWSVEISDRTPETNCPGCGVQMYVGMKGAPRTAKRDAMIKSSFLKCIINDSMPPAYYPGSSGRVKVSFSAPTQEGLYYITHLQAWDSGCDPITAKFDRFSTSPKDAIAVVRVGID